MAIPFSYHLITKPCFRICSTCLSHSQAPFCLYTRRMISNHSEGTFGRLRYFLGGDRPSQTAHLTLSPSLLQGPGLESQQSKSGIPKLTPRTPKCSLLRLPPILCINCRDSISSYSKALRLYGVFPSSRGLIRIFTYTTISPGLLLRQRPSRYSIRAGRNLPDKEFRYLRTVIVTAAVHWGLSSSLRLR